MKRLLLSLLFLGGCGLQGLNEIETLYNKISNKLHKSWLIPLYTQEGKLFQFLNYPEMEEGLRKFMSWTEMGLSTLTLENFAEYVDIKEDDLRKFKKSEFLYKKIIDMLMQVNETDDYPIRSWESRGWSEWTFIFRSILFSCNDELRVQLLIDLIKAKKLTDDVNKPEDYVKPGYTFLRELFFNNKIVSVNS